MSHASYRTLIRLVMILALIALPALPPVGGDTAQAAPTVTEEPWGIHQTLRRNGVFRVAVDADTLAVADYEWESGRGAVRVYGWTGTSWNRTQTLRAPGAAPPPGEGDGFGSSIDIHGDVMAVGQNEVRTGRYAVHVFVYRNGAWHHDDELSGIEPVSVAVWDGTVAVAGREVSTSDRGAFIYEPSGLAWTETARIPNRGGDGCEPGSVDMWGKRLVIGTYHSHDPCSPAARVYRHDGASWVQEQKLNVGAGNGLFDKWLAIWDHTIAIGDPDITSPTPTGHVAKVRLFERSGQKWTRTQTIRRARPTFGGSVAVNGDTLIAGDTGQGGAWVYTRTDEGWRFARRLTKGGVSVAVYGPVVLNSGPASLTSRNGRADAYRLVRCNALVPTMVGSDGDETLIGTGHSDVILAAGGRDRVESRDGPDVVCGGDGRDVLIGGAGADVVLGGTGADTIRGGPGSDDLRGHRGDDSLYGNRGNDTLNGGGGVDLLDGGSGTDVCTNGETNLNCE